MIYDITNDGSLIAITVIYIGLLIAKATHSHVLMLVLRVYRRRRVQGRISHVRGPVHERRRQLQMLVQCRICTQQ